MVSLALTAQALGIGAVESGVVGNMAEKAQPNTCLEQ